MKKNGGKDIFPTFFFFLNRGRETFPLVVRKALSKPAPFPTCRQSRGGEGDVPAGSLLHTVFSGGCFWFGFCFFPPRNWTFFEPLVGTGIYSPPSCSCSSPLRIAGCQIHQYQLPARISLLGSKYFPVKLLFFFPLQIPPKYFCVIFPAVL